MLSLALKVNPVPSPVPGSHREDTKTRIVVMLNTPLRHEILQEVQYLLVRYRGIPL
jgi:hypothetical protein